MIKPINLILQRNTAALLHTQQWCADLSATAKTTVKLAKILVLGTAVSLGIGGCSKDGGGFGKNRVLFDGNYYPTSLKSTRRTRQTIAVKVGRADQGVSGALQAAKLASTRHCILYYGTSDVLWDQPVDEESLTASLSNGTLALTGKCDY